MQAETTNAHEYRESEPAFTEKALRSLFGGWFGYGTRSVPFVSIRVHSWFN